MEVSKEMLYSPGKKRKQLMEYLSACGSVAVAFSGGVDSTFLLAAAKEALGDRVLAVTLKSCLIPEQDLAEAEKFCQSLGVKHRICEVDPLSIPGFAENPPERCYICKKNLFEQLERVAAEEGISVIAEGSNMDDLGDYRPGLKAIAELGVKSPLREVGLYKEEIRLLSREMGLPTWKKPSFACLASRFVYGEPITAERLRMVEKAEALLKELGFTQYRVRIHGLLSRIEVLPEDIERIMQPEIRQRIQEELRGYGFSYVTVDLDGYRMGSMNEGI